MRDPQAYPHTEFNSNRYPLKRDKIQQIQGEKVKQMLNQVNIILDHLLKDLSCLYRANGINYCTQHYHHTLVRILTPFQLLSHFQVADNHDLFNLDDTSKTNENIFSDMSNDSQTIIKQELCFTPGYFKAEGDSEQKNQTKRKKTNKTYIRRKERAKPILNYEIECILADWAFKKLKQKKMVRRKDLAKKAMKLNGYKQGFYGSIGWAARFLNRHPKLKQQIGKVARNNLGRRVPDYEDSEIDQQQIQYERFTEDKYSPIQKHQLKQQDQDNSHQFNEYEQSSRNLSPNFYKQEKDDLGNNQMGKIEEGGNILTGNVRDGMKRTLENKMITKIQPKRRMDERNENG